MKRGIRWAVLVTALLLATGGATSAQNATAVVQFEFNITAPTMVAALMQFSEQARMQLVFPTDGTGDIVAPHVVGVLTPRDALEQLLRGSGLRYEFVNIRTVSVSLARTQTGSPR